MTAAWRLGLWILLAWVTACSPALPMALDRGEATPSPTLPAVVPTGPTPSPAPSPRPSPTPTPGPEWRTLQALEQARPPLHDPITFVREVLGRPVVWATPTPGPPLSPGRLETFYVHDFTTQRTREIRARLVYAGPVAYLWVEEGLEPDPEAVRAFMEAFETDIYPTTRQYFGSEWKPGIDGDPRLHLLYVRTLEGGVAGYFASVDEWPRDVHPYSNQRELLIFSAQATGLQGPWARSLLAHELQHMIHWYQDRNESAWVNEGASELAALLNRGPAGFAVYSYLQEPDIQLNTWPDPQQGTLLPHYGASFLFLLYFWEQLGDDALRDLIAHPENGWDGIQAVLARYQPERSLEAFFLDWLTANLLQDTSLGQGRYGYRSLDLDPLRVQDVRSCPITLEGVVSPFGVDVYRLACPGAWRLGLQAPATVALFPTAPRSGRFAFWSGYADGSEMRLTRRFDLSRVQGPVTLTYWTWFDLEPEYDFVYLLASRDGRRWEMLRTPSGTDANGVGNNYGWGYTGPSGGRRPPRWIREEVDLSAYAGGPVWIRFVYVTDAAVNYTGFLLDDVRIDALGYREDFESEDHGWEAEGFVRVTNRVPARYRWRLVHRGPEAFWVQDLPIEAGHRGEALVDIPQEGETYLLITLLTRYTREPSPYTFTVQPP